MWLIWLLPYFPSLDGPSHVYNLAILYDLINGGREWGEFYTYQLHIVPNLGFNLFVYPMLYFFSPLAAERLFLSVYIVLMAVSVPLLLKAFERESFPLSYLVFPVIFNFPLMMGFYSYTIAVPFFFLAFTLVWKNRHASLAAKVVLFNIAGIVIFYLHLIPFFFFLLSLTAISAASSKGFRQGIYNIVRLGLITSPLFLNLIYYFLTTDESFLISFVPRLPLLGEFFLFSTVNFFWQILPGSLFAFLIVLLWHTTLKDMRKRGYAGISEIEKTLIYLSASMFLIYLFAPYQFGEGGFFNLRLPWVILLVSLPLLKIPDNDLFKRFKTIIVIGIVGIFFVFNVFVLWQQSRKVERFLSGLHAVSEGSFVMAYKTNKSDKSDKSDKSELSRVDVLGHAASYYGIFKGCVNIGNYEPYVSFFPVKFRKDMPSIPNTNQIAYEPESINFSDYPSIQYLIGWEVNDRDRKNLAKHFHIIFEKDELSVWEREQLL